MPQQTPDVHLLDGSVTQAPPAAVLRQAAYERRAAERRSADWPEDVASTMDVSRFEDGSSKILKSGVQLIGKVPLVVHLYREHLVRKCHRAPTPLRPDATGSVTRQVGEKQPEEAKAVAAAKVVADSLLSHANTREFGRYFRATWLECVPKWTLGRRDAAGVSTTLQYAR